MYMRFGPSQLSCLGSSVGRALCLEYRVSWVRVPPESHLRQLIFSRKSDCLGCAVLLCFALFVCLTLLASFFLPSHLSFKNMYIARFWGSFCSVIKRWNWEGSRKESLADVELTNQIRAPRAL